MTATFPTTPRVAYPVVKIPSFANLAIDYGNKVQQRISLGGCQYRFKVHFKTLSQDDMQTVLNFFVARRGNYESFYFQNAQEAFGSRKWKANTAYVAGDIVRPVTATGRSYKCTTAGTSHNTTEPTWGTTVNGTTADNGVTWTENTYLVTFAQGVAEIEYFTERLANYQDIELVEVSA